MTDSCIRSMLFEQVSNQIVYSYLSYMSILDRTEDEM